MKTISVVEQPLPITESITQYYTPSWVDRFNNWVNRLPVAPWVFYTGLWLLFFIIESINTWLDGIQPFGKLSLIYLFYTFYGVYFLAAIHYLDDWVKTAFNTFRPVLAVGDEEQSLLFYQLTTMPARPVWILCAFMLTGITVMIRPVIIHLWEAMGFFHFSPVSTVIDLGFFYFNGLFVALFVYHTLRQLSWISRIHNAATRINIFQLRPLYSLSGLTARTAGILLLVGYIIQQQTVTHGNMTSDPYILQVSWLFTLISILLYSLLAVAVFFLPLLGLHQLLLREKERLQAEANSRLQAHIQELHRRIDAGQLQDADAINSHLTSLSLERDILAKLPTWPWQPGTLNLILTAVLLPIILWFLQQLLGRWVGL